MSNVVPFDSKEQERILNTYNRATARQTEAMKHAFAAPNPEGTQQEWDDYAKNSENTANQTPLGSTAITGAEKEHKMGEVIQFSEPNK